MPVTLAETLAPYADLAIQAVNTEFPSWGIDFVPYPKNKTLPDRVAITNVTKKDGEIAYVQFIRGEMHWPYGVTSDEAKSEATGNIGCVILGSHARGLPTQAHELMLERTADEIIAKKVLFFPFERPKDKSQLSNDLRLAKEQTLIPFYPTHLPECDEVEVLAQMKLALPIIPARASSDTQRRIALIKRQLLRLLSLKNEEATDALTEIAGELQELKVSSDATTSIQTTAYLLRYAVGGALRFHIALVHHPA